jgi:hypothetical protein
MNFQGMTYTLVAVGTLAVGGCLVCARYSVSACQLECRDAGGRPQAYVCGATCTSGLQEESTV